MNDAAALFTTASAFIWSVFCVQGEYLIIRTIQVAHTIICQWDPHCHAHGLVVECHVHCGE